MKPKISKKPSISRKAPVQMPQFDSMAQASSATGIPLAALKMAKAQGCDAFKHGRVDVGLFVRWWFARTQEDDGEALDWDVEAKKQSALDRKTVRLKREGKLIPIDEVAAGRAIAVQTFCAELARIKRDMPAILKGLDEAGIRAKLAEHEASVKPRIVAAFERIGRSSED